jgi:hypothetical protein
MIISECKVRVIVKGNVYVVDRAIRASKYFFLVKANAFNFMF